MAELIAERDSAGKPSERAQSHTARSRERQHAGDHGNRFCGLAVLRKKERQLADQRGREKQPTIRRYVATSIEQQATSAAQVFRCFCYCSVHS